MFVSRVHFLTSVLYLTSLLVCCQFYPMDSGDERLYDHYGMGLAKKDPSLALKNSLLSALLMSDMPKGSGSSSQRKKAVDSTFIRFGRSSLTNANKKPSSIEDNQLPQDFDYYGEHDNAARKPFLVATTADNVPSGKYYQVDKEAAPRQLATIQDGCLVKNKNDLYQVLLGKACVRPSPKMKRENVNDTFIRFGKRDVSSSLARAGDSDDIKYGR